MRANSRRSASRGASRGTGKSRSRGRPTSKSATKTRRDDGCKQQTRPQESKNEETFQEVSYKKKGVAFDKAHLCDTNWDSKTYTAAEYESALETPENQGCRLVRGRG